MNRKHLYLVAGVIWGIPGIIISLKGINAYRIQPPEDIWWLALITAAVLTAFFLMFRRTETLLLLSKPFCSMLYGTARKSPGRM